ncbi:MAG: sigma-70 family RNA polymerase sigma factor [Trueperaceae bacterium]|nr:sigma-70 family RNA polymerase sigma factor [Trueperaceae bacterium]
MRAVATGQSWALDELYRRHSRELTQYIYWRLGDKQLTEETLQDVMLAVWQGARRYRGDASVRTWLFAIAHRRALSARRKLPRAAAAEWVAESLASQDPEPMERVAERQRAEAVRAALAALPDQQRTVIELVYLHGLTGPEAARVLRVPLGTVKSRQSRALAALAPLLEELAP